MSLATKEKPCRIDLRLTQHQRSSYEQAATLKGKTLSQWSTAALDSAAQYDIKNATTTTLSAEAFDSFCTMLEQPLPQETQELLARKEIWA